MYTVLCMNAILSSLQNKQLVWRAGQTGPKSCVSDKSHTLVKTGYQEMDQALNGGWPSVGVVEIQSALGIGELRLVLPSFVSQQQDRLLVFIAPPWRVNAEMLHAQGVNLSHVVIVNPRDEHSALWSAEQCLKSGCCAAVFMWHKQLQMHQVKRLQLASAQGQSAHFIFNTATLSQGLPFTLSLTIMTHADGLKVKINKRKGGWPTEPFVVNMRSVWPKLVQYTNREQPLEAELHRAKA